MKIAGVDEAGRGPLAGPVVAGAVILPDGFYHPLIKDSKKLSIKQRAEAYQIITDNALAWKVISVGSKRIDEMNILRASLWAMAKAASYLKPDLILVDGNQLIPTLTEQKCIIGGDSSEPSISAASILAKVTRDRLMGILSERFPVYGFQKHFGYPTALHKKAIEEHGPSKIHRFSFRGVAKAPSKANLESSPGIYW